MVDSFAKYTCSPKFRESFEVHRLYEKFHNLRSEYETSKEYGCWLTSGQNDAKNFYPNFQSQMPLHVMLHEFLLKNQLSGRGRALSRVNEAYAYDSLTTLIEDSSVEDFIPTSTSTIKNVDPVHFRKSHVKKRRERTGEKEKNTRRKKTKTEYRTDHTLTNNTRREMRTAKEELQNKRHECEMQDARYWYYILHVRAVHLVNPYLNCLTNLCLQSMEIQNSQEQVVLEKNPCGNVRGRQRL